MFARAPLVLTQDRMRSDTFCTSQFISLFVRVRPCPILNHILTRNQDRGWFSMRMIYDPLTGFIPHTAKIYGKGHSRVDPGDRHLTVRTQVRRNSTLKAGPRKQKIPAALYSYGLGYICMAQFTFVNLPPLACNGRSSSNGSSGLRP